MLKALTAGAAVAAAAALLLPTASLASTAIASNEDGVQTVVSYGDLNLATARGTHLLQRRINVAAAQVCGTSRPVDLESIKASRECVSGAIASAQPAFDEAIAAARRGSVTVIPGASLIVIAPSL